MAAMSELDATDAGEWEDTSRTVWTWVRHDEHHRGDGYILVESTEAPGCLLCPVCGGVVLVPMTD